MTRRNLFIAFASAASGLVAAGFAQKTVVPKPQDKLALANQNVKELLLLMDSDKSGKVSKHEWMSFMEAEFNKLDTDGSGELDPKELSYSKYSVKQVC